MITKESYTIHLPVYEGPLDLLLELIEQAELDITKIALAQVTDQYLSYLRQIPEHHLEDLTSFLIVAARLLQIKSEALLPRPPEREPRRSKPQKRKPHRRESHGSKPREGQGVAESHKYRKFKHIRRHEPTQRIC